MKNFVIAIMLVLVTACVTFKVTMDKLYIVVNPVEQGAMVECFGQVWYHDFDLFEEN